MIVKQNNQKLQHLQYPIDVLDINHSIDYVYHVKGKKHERKIYNNVEYSQFEQDKIQEFKKYLVQQNYELPNEWNDCEILKQLHNCNFKHKQTIETINDVMKDKKHLINYENINDKAKQILNCGIFYQNGRDFQFRPIIIVDIAKIDAKNMDENAVVQALCCLLNEVKSNMFIPGYIENWIIILDFGGKGLFGMPTKLIGKIIENLSKNYCGSLEQIYILNPSSSLKFMWGALSSFMDDDVQAKITFIKGKKDYAKLHKAIPISQLEQKFSGLQPNVQCTFPPLNTIPLETEELRQKNQMLVCEYIKNNQETWIVKQLEESSKKQDSSNSTNNTELNDHDDGESCDSIEKKDSQSEQRLQFQKNQSHNLNQKEIEEKCCHEKNHIRNKLIRSQLQTKQNQDVMNNSNVKNVDQKQIYTNENCNFNTPKKSKNNQENNNIDEFIIVRENHNRKMNLYSSEKKGKCKGCIIF